MTNKEIFKFLKPFIIQEKKKIILAIVFAFLNSLIGVMYGYLIGYAINAAIIFAIKTAIITMVINLFLVFIQNAIFNKQSTIISTKASFNIIEKINFALFEKVMYLPTKAFEEKSSGEFINRITTDSETITDSIGTLLNIIIRVLTSALVLIYVFINSWFVALEIIIYLILLYKMDKKYKPKFKEYQKAIKEKNDQYVASVDESIHGIREIRALGIHKNRMQELQNIIKSLFHKRNQSVTFEQNYYAWVYIFDEVFVAIAFITIMVLIVLGKSELTFLVAMSYYIYNFMNLVNSFATFSTSYQKLKVSVERIYEIVNNKLYQDVEFGSVHNLAPKGHLVFNNLSFHYHDNKENILNNFNLTVDANTNIAIVGKSGEGKSTIFNLLLRYFDPIAGSILLDGIDLKEFDEESLRNNISIIRQDPFLFHQSILENFKMIHPKITLKEVRKYCKMALLDEYIMGLPKKYNTIIGEGGVNLSGGQKQRLAIARALSKKSKIILLDEATSALDNEAQECIMKVMKDIAIDHTIITIAHRLSTIRDADVIHVMDHGQIIESGTHKELLKKSTIYKDLYKNNA